MSQYKSIYLVAVQINYSEDTINSLTTKEEISTFTRKTLRKLKNEIATALLSLEMIIQFPYLLVAVVTVANAVELLINLVKTR